MIIMYYILVSLHVLALISLASCSVITKDKVEFEKIAEDVAVELVDDAALL